MCLESKDLDMNDKFHLELSLQALLPRVKDIELTTVWKEISKPFPTTALISEDLHPAATQ